MGLYVDEGKKTRKATACIITADVDVYYPTAQKRRIRGTYEERQVVITTRR